MIFKKLKKTKAEIDQDKLIALWKKKNHKMSVPSPKKTPDEIFCPKSIRRLKTKSYKKFLKSAYWKLVRKMVLERDGYKCVVCVEQKDLYMFII